MYRCLYMSVYYVHAWCPRKPEEVMRFLGIRVINSHEPPCECWELNLDSQEEWPILLTADHLSSSSLRRCHVSLLQTKAGQTGVVGSVYHPYAELWRTVHCLLVSLVTFEMGNQTAASPWPVVCFALSQLT